MTLARHRHKQYPALETRLQGIVCRQVPWPFAVVDWQIVDTLSQAHGGSSSPCSTERKSVVNSELLSPAPEVVGILQLFT